MTNLINLITRVDAKDTSIFKNSILAFGHSMIGDDGMNFDLGTFRGSEQICSGTFEGSEQNFVQVLSRAPSKA